MTEEEVIQKARNKIEERNIIGARLGFEDGYVIGYFDAIAENNKQIEELKRKDCLSVDCDKAQKNGDLCLGYGGDEDEPCEQCKNCIKCETGYYQLGETEKDKQIEELQDKLGTVQMQKAGEKSDLVSHLVKANEDYKKQIAELTLKIRGLEIDCEAYNYSQRTYQEVIEKMKCCARCIHYEHLDEYCNEHKLHPTCIDCCEDWKLNE